MMDKPHYAASEGGDSDYADKGLPEFVPPAALNLEGMEGEASVKWRRKNGRICIVSMDGVSLADADSESDEPAPDDEEGRMGVEAMDAQMNPEA